MLVKQHFAGMLSELGKTAHRPLNHNPIGTLSSAVGNSGIVQDHIGNKHM